MRVRCGMPRGPARAVSVGRPLTLDLGLESEHQSAPPVALVQQRKAHLHRQVGGAVHERARVLRRGRDGRKEGWERRGGGHMRLPPLQACAMGFVARNKVPCCMQPRHAPCCILPCMRPPPCTFGGAHAPLSRPCSERTCSRQEMTLTGSASSSTCRSMRHVKPTCQWCRLCSSPVAAALSHRDHHSWSSRPRRSSRAMLIAPRGAAGGPISAVAKLRGARAGAWVAGRAGA